MAHRIAPIIRTETTTAADGTHGVRLVVACPYCHAEHWHGGGPSILTARTYLGHRAAHCAHKAPTNNGYMVADPNGLLPGSTPAPTRTARNRT